MSDTRHATKGQETQERAGGGNKTGTRGIAERITALREARGWNQSELAAHCDLTRQAVSLLEGGARSPSLATLYRIARALQVDPAALLSET